MSAGLAFKIDGKRLCTALPRAGQPLAIASSLGPSYNASFARGNAVFDEVNALEEKGRVFVLADKKVLDLYGARLKIRRERIFAAPADESFKTLRGVSRFLTFLDRSGAARSDTLLVIGGGIMQDSGGFASTIYKRGMHWVYVPTTLLSMSDSCVGAKTGINFGSAKNQLGVFAKPAAVLIDPRLLATLEHRHVRSGLGEVLKMCVIGGEKAMQLYAKDVHSALARDTAALQRLIALSLSIKKAVVEEDELEHGIRRALNYGHTVGHALEALSNFRISHGEGVVLGMAAANALAVSQGLLSSKCAMELESCCVELCAGAKLPRINPEMLAGLLLKDKKNVGGKVFFVVPRKPGDMIYLQREPGMALWRNIMDTLERLSA